MSKEDLTKYDNRFVKDFKGQYQEELKNEINNYAKDNDVEIKDISYTTFLKEGYFPHRAMVLFEKK